MEMRPEAMLVMMPGMKNGLTRPGPFQPPDPIWSLVAHLQLAILDRHHGRCHRVLDEEIHLTDLFLLDPLQGIKVLHLRRDLTVVIGRVKGRDPPHPRGAAHEGLPKAIDADADGRNHSHPRHHHTPHDISPQAGLPPGLDAILDILYGILDVNDLFRILV